MDEERNEEMSLREALENAFTEEAAQEGGTAEAVSSAEVPAAAVTEAEQTTEEQAAESPVVSPVEPVGGVPEQAVPQQTGGMPTHAEMWQAFQQVVAENQRLSRELQQVSMAQNAAMQQQSEAAEGAIMGQFTPEAAVPLQTPPAMSAPPVLNMAEFNYLDPEKQQEMLAKWQQESMSYAARMAAAQIKEEIYRDIAPVREDYETKRRIAEDDAAKATVFAMPQFADMSGKEEEIDRVIANTPLLQKASPEEKYMFAALISRGIHSAKQPTTEELIDMAKSNPDVMKAIEASRVAEIQKNNESLPKVVPSSGMGNVNAVPENKPKTMDDVKRAFERLYRR